MYNDMLRQLGGVADVRTVTEDDFNQYGVSEYNTMFPLGQHGHGPNIMAQTFMPPVAATNAPATACMTPAQEFNRGIEKDKDHYTEIKVEKSYDKFRHNVEATAHTRGTFDILDPHYTPDPSNTDEVALFQPKQNFMYTVFEKILQTDKSASLVRQYEAT
jgi:hypothetical protein